MPSMSGEALQRDRHRGPVEQPLPPMPSMSGEALQLMPF
jgi:hypothetical protein